MFEKLKAMGYTDEEARKLEKVFKEELDGNYVTKDRFNQVNEDNKTLKSTVKERDTQLESLKKNAGDKEALEAQIEQLKKSNKEAQEKYEADLKASKIKSAVKLKIGDQVHDTDMVSSLLDLSKIELDDNDNIKSGFDEQFNNLKKDKAFLFKQKDENKNNFKFEGAKNFESNKDKDGGDGQPKGIGAQLAEAKLGIQGGNNRATDYYFGGSNPGQK